MAEIVDSTESPCDRGSASRLASAGFRRWLAIAVLMSSAPAMALMFGALGPILPMIAAHFNDGGDGAFMAQMVMTTPAIGVILGGLCGGFLIERLGIRPILFGALAAYALAGAAGLYLDSIWALLGARFLVGVAVANLSTAVMLLIGAWFEGVARARLLGYQAACAGVASVTALLVSGALAERLGWRAPFAIYLVAFAVLAVAAVAIPSVPVRAPESARRADRGSLLSLWPIYALQMPLFLAYFMTSVQLSFLLAADGVTSAVTRSIVIAVGVLAGAISGASYGRLYARLGDRGMPLVLMALMAAGFLVIGTAHSLPLIGLGSALAGGGGGMISPYVSGRLLTSAAADIRPRALGLMFTTIYVADFLNPVLVNPVRISLGIHAAYMAVAGLLVVGIVAMWRRRPVRA